MRWPEALCAVLLAAAATTAGAQAKCEYSRITEMPLWVQGGRPILDGEVNGQKVAILVDTGAASSFVHRSAAAKLGLVPQEVPGYRMFGVGGESAAQAVLLEEFRFGHSVRKNWRVLVTGEDSRESGISVYLGNDFLQGFDVEFDLAFGALRLFQAKGCDNVALSYWTTGPAGQASIDSHSAPELTVRINGRPVRALLDSGAVGSIITMDLALSLGVTPASPGAAPAGCSVGLGKQPIETFSAPFESFAIGDEVVHNPRLRFAELWRHSVVQEAGSRVPRKLDGLPSMLLGADFLRSHRVLIANSQRKIYFTHNGGPVFPAVPSRSCDKPRS